jgi:hypothetical protein
MPLRQGRKLRDATPDVFAVSRRTGTDGGIAAVKPHGLLPVSVAFVVEGGVSTVAALASATAGRGRVQPRGPEGPTAGRV